MAQVESLAHPQANPSNDRMRSIMRRWPEFFLALAALGALYLFWWHLFA
jgi:hypothetical protein